MTYLSQRPLGQMPDPNAMLKEQIDRGEYALAAELYQTMDKDRRYEALMYLNARLTPSQMSLFESAIAGEAVMEMSPMLISLDKKKTWIALGLIATGVWYFTRKPKRKKRSS